MQFSFLNTPNTLHRMMERIGSKNPAGCQQYWNWLTNGDLAIVFDNLLVHTP